MGPRPDHGPRLQGRRRGGIRRPRRAPADAPRDLRPRRVGRRELPGLQVRRHRRVAAPPRVEEGPRPSRLRGDRQSVDELRGRGAPPRLSRQRHLVGSAHRRVPGSVRRPRRHRRAPAARRRSGHVRRRQPARAARRAVRRPPRLHPGRRGARDLPDDPARRPAGRARLGRGRETAVRAAAVSGLRAGARPRRGRRRSGPNCTRSSASCRSRSGTPRATSGCTRCR